MGKERKSRELTDDARLAIFNALQSKARGEKLPYGALTAVAKNFNASSRTVRGIWLRGKNAVTPAQVEKAVRGKKKGKVGRPRADIAALHEALRNTPQPLKSSLRQTANTIGIPKSTLWNAVKRGDIEYSDVMSTQVGKQSASTLTPLYSSSAGTVKSSAFPPG